MFLGIQRVAFLGRPERHRCHQPACSRRRIRRRRCPAAPGKLGQHFLDQRHDRILDALVDAGDDVLHIRRHIAQAQQPRQQVDRGRDQPGQHPFNRFGRRLDDTVGNVDHALHDGQHDIDQPRQVILQPHDEVPDHQDQFQQGPRRVDQRCQPDDARLDHAFHQKRGNLAHHHAGQIGEVALDLVKKCAPALGDQSAGIADEEFDFCHRSLADDAHRNFAHHVQRQAQDLPCDVQHAHQVELRGDSDRARKGPGQPANDARNQVILEIVGKPLKPAHHGGQQIAEKSDRIVDDIANRRQRIADKGVKVILVDPQRGQDGFQDQPRHFGPVAGQSGFRNREQAFQRTLDKGQDRVQRGFVGIHDKADRRLQPIRHQIHRGLRQRHAFVDQRVQFCRKFREH